MKDWRRGTCPNTGNEVEWWGEDVPTFCGEDECKGEGMRPVVNPTKKTRYLVIGGPVRSKIDGDYHYVYARELCALYGLKYGEHDVTMAEEGGTFLKGFDTSGFVILRPRYDGDYTLPDC